MDDLSEVLRVVALGGGVFLDAEFTEPFAFVGKAARTLCTGMPVHGELICFHYVIEGGFHVSIEGVDEAWVAAGQTVMLPRNPMHVLASRKGLLPTSGAQVDSDGGGLPRLRHGGGGAMTRVVCGFLAGNELLEAIVSTLPNLLVLDVAALRTGQWIADSFRMAAMTQLDAGPGSAVVLTKMSELLFLESLRRHLMDAPAEDRSWAAGLRDPQVRRALSLLHARPTEPWTADDLAAELGMSRSAFATKFTSVMGMPPMRYLTRWRMRLAASDLTAKGRSVSEVAFDLGYSSEAAFTRAFRREFGAPPGEWRARASAN
ncbi:MAG TPA: AraC family transcriptional regulator [Caulobacteraceae bacterium]